MLPVRNHNEHVSSQDKESERAFFDSSAERAMLEDDHADHFGGFSDELYAQCLSTLDLNAAALNGKRMLEAGCATGAWGKRLALLGAEVIGVDISEKMVSLNRRLNADVPRYSARTGDLEDANLFPENHFDAVGCFLVLHHFPNIACVANNFSLWMKPGATLYLVEPNGGNWVNALSKIARGIVKRLSPESLTKHNLSTINEDKDHSLKDYLEVFVPLGFRLTKAQSIVVAQKFPAFVFSPRFLISLAKWVAYGVTGILPIPTINKGNPLVISLTLAK
jgi:SAM-dependent methyltransferase